MQSAEQQEADQAAERQQRGWRDTGILLAAKEGGSKSGSKKAAEKNGLVVEKGAVRLGWGRAGWNGVGWQFGGWGGLEGRQFLRACSGAWCSSAALLTARLHLLGLSQLPAAGLTAAACRSCLLV